MAAVARRYVGSLGLIAVCLQSGGFSTRAAARRFDTGELWIEAQPDLDPEKLVFIDECGVSTRMARLRGRAKRSQRCRAAIR
jgi:hypothetical protein